MWDENTKFRIQECKKCDKNIFLTFRLPTLLTNTFQKDENAKFNPKKV